MKTTYFKTTVALKKAAKKANIPGTILEYGSAQCNCGESFAIRLIDLESLGTLEIFIDCPVCYVQYES